MKTNFYCQQKCGEVGFYIDEWNKSYNEINALPISEIDKRKLIDGEPCEKQCFDCIAIVGETRLKNAKRELERAGYNVDELIKEGIDIINKLKQVRNEKR